MSLWALVLIALGVSADAFAVALGKGLHMRKLDLRQAAVIALTFGLFQGLMPLIGWFLGSRLQGSISEFDHWIAFGLLALIGGKMLWEAFTSQPEVGDHDQDRLSRRELLILAVATSIDALAVGVTLALVSVNIAAAAVLIGVVTMVLSFVGVVIGFRAGVRFRGPAEIAGGAILILIGLRILLDHLGVI